VRNWIHFLVVVAVAAGCLTLGGHAQEAKKAEQKKVEAQKPDPKKLRELMFRKLENSQKLLAAICLNDLDSVTKHGQTLIQLSKEAEWKVYKTPQYEMNSEDFRSTAEKLVSNAKEKNLEGAKLAYLEMTLTCFHCHKYVRDVGMARFEPAPDR
jgi:hypothetical protein